jgi:hypothetical protein
VSSPVEVDALRGRLRVASTNRGWAAAVLVGAALVGMAEALGMPPVVVVTVALLVPLVVVGDLVIEIMLRRRSMVVAGLESHLADERGLHALDRLEEPTHGHLSLAAEGLAAARERMLAIGGSGAQGLETVVGALAVVEGLEDAIRETGPARAVRRGDGRWRAVGGLAAKNSYHAEDDPMTLYQDPLNLPDWIRGPRIRDVLMRFGAVLDDVRLLHDARIEWSVLLFTMWARLVLVALAPLLAGATFGRAPLSGGFKARDVPWLVAVILSSVTAVAAPRVAQSVMRRDSRGAEVRGWLLVVEIPVAVAAMLATPCWPVASFAAGWTNWWQRPTFSWRKLIAWILSVSACLIVGMLLADLAGGRIAPEIAVSMAVIAVIGSSQGAMLPISMTMLAQVIVGGLVSPRRARHRADEQISSAIRQLLEAATVIETRSATGDVRATADADSLREVAIALAARADTTDHWAGRVPLGLRALLETALQRGGGPRYASPTAAYQAAEAERTGIGEPLTTMPPSFYSDALAGLRLKHRAHARSLSLLVVKIVEEARRYGTGALQTRCHREDDRLVLRFANPIRRGSITGGRGTGAGTLRKLAGEIPGCAIDSRDVVDGAFVDLPAAAQRFGVQVSFPMDLFEDGAHSRTRA